MDLKEKASYCLGLLEGAHIDFNKEENKVLRVVVDLLQEVCEEVYCLGKTCEESVVLLDELDEDLANVERYMYDVKDVDCSDEKVMKGCGCHQCQDEDYEDVDEEENFETDGGFIKESDYEVSCPNCGRVTELNNEIFEKEDIICPECGEKINFDFKNSEN